MKPILHLNLKQAPFTLIKEGFKKAEYREIKPYWNRVFTQSGRIKIKGKYYHPTDVIICFSHGYTRNREQIFVQCTGLVIGFGKPEWLSVADKQYYILSLGEIIKTAQS